MMRTANDFPLWLGLRKGWAFRNFCAVQHFLLLFSVIKMDLYPGFVELGTIEGMKSLPLDPI